MRIFLLMLFLNTGIVFSQGVTNERVELKGLVTTANGNPIKGAILYVDSVKTFVRTNRKGFYKTKIYKDTESVMVYAPAHGLYSKDFNGTEELNFQFVNSIDHLTENDLEELGYITEAPRKGTIDPSKFKEFSTIYQLIREMFTGVEVNGNRIVVRGVSSFGDNTPLFIVDDNYVTDISFVLRAEVKSIQLLKGSDATMYGSRGTNGVFIIHLRK